MRILIKYFFFFVNVLEFNSIIAELVAQSAALNDPRHSETAFRFDNRYGSGFK